MNNDMALANKCMKILCEKVGALETERFIHFITANRFDYTEWQREHYDAIPEDVLSRDIDDFCKAHPFRGKAKRL